MIPAAPSGHPVDFIGFLIFDEGFESPEVNAIGRR